MKATWLLCLLVVAPAMVSANVFEVAMNAYSLFVSGGRILHDVAGGMGLLSKMIHSFDYFLDYSAEEQVAEALDDSADTASTGSESQRASAASQSGSSQTISGCGVLGLQITDESLPTESLTSCCKSHDDCYASSCNVKKRKCDQELGECLKIACDDLTLERQARKNCQGAAKLLYSGTMALSSQQYSDAQDQLSCRKEGKRRGRR